MTYQGITLDFKRSDEYKDLYRMVKTLDPKMHDYLVDLIIHEHKTNPKAYRDKTKYPTPEKKPRFITDDEAVKIISPEIIDGAANTESERDDSQDRVELGKIKTVLEDSAVLD